MTIEQVSPGDRLRKAREQAGYGSARAASDAMGVPSATYAQHESGLRGFRSHHAERYGRFFKVAPEWLLLGRQGNAEYVPVGPQTFVKGEVQAGVFKEAWQWEPEDWVGFSGRADLAAPPSERFGLRVVGDSMNEVYPSGSTLECVKYHGETIASGRRVIVQRTRSDGTIETTVKELIRTEDGVEWLRPRSTNPTFLPFRGDRPDAPDIVQVEIIAVVVGSYRPE